MEREIAKVSKQPRTIKRARRSKADVERFRQAMLEFCEEHHPLSVRNLYYLMAQAQLVPKNDKGYRTVVEDSGKLREAGRIPFAWLKDESRQVIQVYTSESLADGLTDLRNQYRRRIWADQPTYAELWCEAEASISTLSPLVEQWHLRLVPVGGFSSKSFLFECAEHLASIEQPISVIYAGDSDPSGLGIETDIKTRLRRYAPGVDFELHRVALTQQQVIDWELPTRPPKPGDSRTKNFAGDSVAELEAIPPNQLRQMCNAAIEELVDHEILLSTKAAEQDDLAQLEELAR